MAKLPSSRLSGPLFVKVGGLADVSAALPKALRALGHTCDDDRRSALLLEPPRRRACSLARRLTPLRFTLGERTIEATVFDGRLASQVDLVVVDVPGLFDRPGVYGERGEDYPDNAVRFAAFSRAVAELVRQRAASGRPIDVRPLQRLADRARPDLPARPCGGDARLSRRRVRSSRSTTWCTRGSSPRTFCPRSAWTGTRFASTASSSTAR